MRAQYLLNLEFFAFQLVLYKLGSRYLTGFVIIPCFLMSDCSISVRNYIVNKCEQTDVIQSYLLGLRDDLAPGSHCRHLGNRPQVTVAYLSNRPQVSMVYRLIFY